MRDQHLYNGTKNASRIPMNCRSIKKVSSTTTCVLFLIVLFWPGHRADAQSSDEALATGNGHGFQLFSASKNTITDFLERPYRYVKADPANPDGEGILRRNLVYDTYFGIRTNPPASRMGKRRRGGK